MKSLFSILLASALLVPAAQLCAQSTAAWTSISDGRPARVDGSSIILPAAAQLARPMPSSGFTLELTTRPVLTAEPASWPVVVLGDLALIGFALDGTAGVAVLVHDAVSHVFELTNPIGRDGRITQPWVVAIKRRGDSIALQLGDEVHAIDALKFGPDAEIVLSAGSTAEWVLDTLTLVGPEGTSLDPGEGARIAARERQPDGATLTGRERTHSTSESSSDSNGLDGAARRATEDLVKDGSRTGSSLEVFTPPAVRRTRADEVRARLQLRQ